jgi:hypothetical protein
LEKEAFFDVDDCDDFEVLTSNVASDKAKLDSVY